LLTIHATIALSVHIEAPDALAFGDIDSLGKMPVPMTSYTFQPTTTSQSVDWSDPAVWIGGVVPDGPGADVVFPVVTLSGGGTDTSFVSIASDESDSVDSVSLTSKAT